MTRAAVCGAIFGAAVDVLGLEPAGDHPELVLLDLDDPRAIATAVAIPDDVPRVVVGTDAHESLLRAIGCRSVAFARSAEAAVLGPLIAAASPARARRATRLAVVTGARGGVGRTLLVTNLAARLAARTSIVVLDATGTGAAGWWLRLAAGPWSDMEGLVDELTPEHLGIVAAERERLRAIGGASAMPSAALLVATARAAGGLADLVLVDAPSLFDERTRALTAIADRVLVVATDDPVSLAAIDGSSADDRTWLIASRCRAERLGAHAVLRSLPDDPASVRAAARGPSPVAGALGRAYDEVAELLAIDIA